MKKYMMLFLLSICGNAYSAWNVFRLLSRQPYPYLHQLGEKSPLFHECMLCKKGWFNKTPKQKECDYLDDKLKSVAQTGGTRSANSDSIWSWITAIAEAQSHSLNEKAVNSILEGYSEETKEQELGNLNRLGNKLSDDWAERNNKE